MNVQNGNKDCMKMMHDKLIIRKDFNPDKKSCLQFTLNLFPEKSKSRWTDPNIAYKVHPHGVIEIHNAMDGATFQVNGHHLKSYRKYLSPQVKKIFLEDSVYQD